MIILLMGVAGAGKTTVGQALARELNWRFVDADDYHSADSIAKMQAGIALEDADRAPWLESLRTAITNWTNAGENVVLACSALKEAYRDVLTVSPKVKIVFLKGSYDLISHRLSQRPQHYMNPGLLRSQFDALEVPYGLVTIDVVQTVPQMIREIRTALAV